MNEQRWSSLQQVRFSAGRYCNTLGRPSVGQFLRLIHVLAQCADVMIFIQHPCLSKGMLYCTSPWRPRLDSEMSAAFLLTFAKVTDESS